MKDGEDAEDEEEEVDSGSPSRCCYYYPQLFKGIVHYPVYALESGCPQGFNEVQEDEKDLLR